MQIVLFAVFDDKAQAYLTPFTQPNPAMAKRLFFDTVNDPNSAIGKHPSDYTLFQLGQIEDETGEFTPDRKTLGNGVEYIDPDRD